MFAFPVACVFTLAFASISEGGIVIRSSTRIPAVFRPMSTFATVLARVDVCRARVGRAGRAISSLVLVFTFALSLTFLERVNLHPVIICEKIKMEKCRKKSKNVQKTLKSTKNQKKKKMYKHFFEVKKVEKFNILFETKGEKMKNVKMSTNVENVKNVKNEKKEDKPK